MFKCQHGMRQRQDCVSVNMETDTEKCVHANVENLETERNTAVSTQKGRNAYASTQKEMDRNM